MVNPTIDHIVRRFKEALQDLYGNRLCNVVLYGSYARGDYNNESDIDLMVVLNDDDVETKFLLDHGFMISPLPVSYTKYITSLGAVYQEVRKEGILL